MKSKYIETEEEIDKSISIDDFNIEDFNVLLALIDKKKYIKEKGLNNTNH